MKTGYHRIKCPVCGQLISCSGLGKTSHFRKHVREGKMSERPRGWPLRNIEFEQVKDRK